MREKLQIRLLRVTVLRIKLFLRFSLNDHMRSYITVLIERGGDVTTVVREAEEEPDTDEPAGRRDNTSLQGTAATTTAVRDVREKEGVAMRAVLSQLIDTAVSAFNQTFLTVTEAAAAS
ncbi:uncharacterized protein BDCG_07994 [Blastomyces dermatitidis ER-3]|uniref:Uncharacterized protein n=1 Tax=Ajellomyces dermatitidis (strain ER-3 / ATCC MYA-2586) TaxID=559297 RepID=A0ABP2EMV9_AJEDR|nr:uncharacterized protein BDCG_07994 [Blastomyces dermatitidis ER-3]EEQ84725.1 hypothetical protein BDCG_07994 [Blastomyces dermatitidis ER-3]